MIESVMALWRFPVKSMQGEQLQAAAITPHGVLGDRAYGVLDVATGKIATAKRVRQFPGLLACRAAFVEPPRLDGELPPVRIDLPNGQSVRSDSGDVDRQLSAYFRREVRLVPAAAHIRTFQQYSIDSGIDDGVDDASDDSNPAGAFKDAQPMSVVTTSTLERFTQLSPGSRFDPRRFRMNLVLATEQPGFIENDWIGRALGVGDGIRLEVSLRDSRCVMTTLPQAELPHDPDILRAIVRHNNVAVGDAGERPCAGVYAAVAAPGAIRTGDPLTLL